MIVLDTNVLSELMRPSPDEGVVTWTAGHPSTRLFTTSITEAEILYGVRLLPSGERREAIEAAATALFAEDLDGRVLPFDRDAAAPYSRIASERRRMGRPISHFDAQIAAIARSRGATVATRNVADFEHCGVELLNPWIA